MPPANGNQSVSRTGKGPQSGGKLGRSDLPSRLHSAAIHLLRALRAEDRAGGLSAPRLSALSVLVFGGARTVGDLAAAEQVSAPTISRLVRDLEREGLVRRSADPSDARISHIAATAKARRVLEQGRARRVGRLERALSKLPAEDRQTVDQATAILERLLGEGL